MDQASMSILALTVLSGAAKAIMATVALVGVVCGVFMLANPRPPSHP